MGKDTYVESLEELIWELHSALELTVFDIEDDEVKRDTDRKARRLWDEYCGCRAKYYDLGES